MNWLRSVTRNQIDLFAFRLRKFRSIERESHVLTGNYPSLAHPAVYGLIEGLMQGRGPTVGGDIFHGLLDAESLMWPGSWSRAQG